MIRYDVECPFCRRIIEVAETTTAKQREAGLVYLSVKCAMCDARIEAGGLGENGARLSMSDKIRKRLGTLPGQWKIKPRGTTRRRGSRR